VLESTTLVRVSTRRLAAIALALECLRLKLRDVKVLGSYPRA